jgi:Rod binding domain-containing protein
MDGIRTTSGAAAAQAHTPVDDKARQKLVRATKDFESLLVGYMLKSMRSSMSTTEMFGDSYGGDVLEGMFDGEMAKHVSQNSSLGLAETLYRKMTGESLPHSRVPARHAAAAGQPAKRAEEKPAIVRPVQPVPVLGTSDATAVTPAAADTTAAVPDSLRRRLDMVAPLIQEASATHGVDGNLLKAIIATESGGNVQARSSKNAKGLMQLIDSTATAMGVRNVWDPRENVLGGAKYLSKLMDQFGGDRAKAVASYNAGPAAVLKHGGIPPFKETQAYVEKVMNYMRFFEQEESGHGDQD